MQGFFGRTNLPHGQPYGAESFTPDLQAYGEDHHHRCAQANGIIAAYCGHPQWSDARMLYHAQHQGMARSLIEGFNSHSSQVLELLHGDFSVAILSVDGSRGLIAIDRMGICGLYYALNGTTLRFSTEIRQIFSDGSVAQRMDAQALYDYVYFHVIPSPRTIYSDVQKLEPAKCLAWNGGSFSLDTYWHPQFASKLEAGTQPTDLQRQVRDCIKDSVQKCDTGQSTGTFLSGGLDSSTVTGMLRRVRAGAAPAFSMGFNEDGYDELPFARIAAQHFGSRLFERYISPTDIEEAVPRLANFFDEPFGNSSAVPTYVCAKFARENGTDVLLAGDGGDELFAGNARYAKQMLFEIYRHAPPWLTKQLLEPWLLGRRHTYDFFPLRKLQRYVQQASTPLPERMEAHNLLNTMDLSQIFESEFLTSINVAEPRITLEERYHDISSESVLDHMLFLDWKITLADNDIRKVSNACSLANIQVRYPMLDDDLVDLSTRIPARLKLKRNKLRAFYKDAMTGFLPNAIIDKPKHGFGLPFGQWLKTSSKLNDMVEDSLANLQTRGIFNQQFIEKVRRSHRNEHAAYFGTTLWVLLMLEQWWQAHPCSV